MELICNCGWVGTEDQVDDPQPGIIISQFACGCCPECGTPIIVESWKNQ
jgi:hypothetical protein